MASVESPSGSLDLEVSLVEYMLIKDHSPCGDPDRLITLCGPTLCVDFAFANCDGLDDAEAKVKVDVYSLKRGCLEPRWDILRLRTFQERHYNGVDAAWDSSDSRVPCKK